MQHPPLTDWSMYLRLLSYLRGREALFLVAILGYLLAALAEGVFAQTIGSVVDAFQPPVEASEHTEARWYWVPDQFGRFGLSPIWIFPLLIFIAAIVRATGAVVGEYVLSAMSFRVIHTVRCELYESMLELPSAFFTRSKQGDLSNRLTDTTSRLRDTVTDVNKIVIQDGVKLVVLVLLMVSINAVLTTLFLVLTPLIWIVMRIASRRFRKISRRIQASMGEVTQVGQETVHAFKIIRTYGGEAYERARFRLASETNRKQQLKLIATKAMSTQLIQVVVAIALGLLVGALFFPQLSSGMTAGELVTYVGYAALLANPTKRLSGVVARVQAGLAAAEEIFAQIDHPAEGDQGQAEARRARGEIEFRNVSFRYDGASKNALTDVSFRAVSGETLAIVGSSGSGKTTLAELLLRFHEPLDGEVLLDGIALRDYQKKSLRSQVAFVVQEEVLFNDTIRANIAYGELASATADEIWEAARRARADEFIRALPEGLDTVVGDRGSRLSHGQRQRISIARAFLKNPPILVLDEATSALDTESEAMVQSALEEAMKDRTTLVIAHRLSTVEGADRILVLEEGRVVEVGTHHSLLESGGRYSKLYSAPLDPEEASPKRRRKIQKPVSRVTPLWQPAIVRAWYSDSRWMILLRPLSVLFGWIVKRRRLAYKTHRQPVWRSPVPVVVVGNISIGGTGKTPLVVWLAQWLKERGVQVGVVSRGYGGTTRSSVIVDCGTDVGTVGDEAPVLAERTQCTVVVDPDRVRAIQHLTDSFTVDIVVSDDGLQHYAMHRDLEIAIVDGTRGCGNGRLLPEGPLREPIQRLSEVDWVVSNGRASGLVANESVCRSQVVEVVNAESGQSMPPQEFAASVVGEVHAYCGMGNPDRFLHSLLQVGLDATMYAFPDHHRFSRSDFTPSPDQFVVVSEKDFRKVVRFVPEPSRLWYLKIDLDFDQPIDEHLCRLFAPLLPKKLAAA